MIQSIDTKYDVVSLMSVLENSQSVLFGLQNRSVVLTQVTLPKSPAKSVKTNSIGFGARRWGRGLSLLYPVRLLLDWVSFDLFMSRQLECLADGMAEVHGCPLLDGKHCIALSFGYR